jgi:hypothetical protein
MNNSQAVALRSKAVSAGTLLLVSCGLAFYQVTSLVLAPQAVRQINLSLSIPAVNADELGAPLGGDMTVVLGELGAIVQPDAPRPAVGLARVAFATAVAPAMMVRPSSVPVVGPAPSTPAATASILQPAPAPAPGDHGSRDPRHGRHLGWTVSQD